jgi:hypothetical protein
MFLLQPAVPLPLKLPTLTLSVMETDQSVAEPGLTATTFDVILILHQRPQGLTGWCIYKTALFEAATIQRMLEDFQRVLERLVTQPEQPLLTLQALRHVPS